MSDRKRQTPLPEHMHLTPDLWMKIMVRLPAKTLLQFRSVCKTWCSFIDSSDFISMHLKRYPNNSANTHILSVEYLHIPNSPDHPNYNIRRSDTMRRTGELVRLMDPLMIGCDDMIDGLLLVHCSEKIHWLWNPTIRKSVVLPKCPFYFTSEVQRFFHLGFDSSSNNYKVVCFELSDSSESELSIAITIYSLRDHCWRTRPNWVNVPKCWYDLFTNRFGVEYCQGALYWRPSKDFNGSIHLLSFNLDTEEFSYVKMPDLKENMFRFCFLMNGSLALLGISWVRTCVWVLEKNNGEVLWKHFSSADSNYNAFKFFSTCEAPRVHIRYIDNSGTLLVHYDGNLMFYNIMTHRVLQRKLKVFECEHLMTYVESLVLHKGYERATLNLPA